MPKSLKSIGLISVFLILSSTALFATEQITITTYYPSPYGVYRELRSQRMAIGENYIKHDTVCWEGAPINCDGLGEQTMIPTGSFDPDTDLIVEGNVGIGTTVPERSLHIVGEAPSSYPAIIVQNYTDVAGDGPDVFFRRVRGTIASPQNVAVGDSIGGLSWHGYKGGVFLHPYPSAILGAFVESIGTAVRSGITFSTTNDNDSFGERVRIDRNGNVGIGTAAPQGSLDIQQDNQDYYGSTYHGSVINMRPKTLDNKGYSAIRMFTDIKGDQRQWSILAGSGGSYPSSNFRIVEERMSPRADFDRLVIDSSGKVGIGMTEPIGIVHSYGVDNVLMSDTSAAAGSAATMLSIRRAHVPEWDLNLGPTNNLHLYNRVPNGYVLSVEQSTGNVGIGTTNPKGKLDVNGTIFQRGVSLHADYVFEPAYKLESIEDHSAYMWQNKHLKAVPVATKDEKGQDIVNWGERNRGVLEELEKAHVYIQQCNERIKVLEAKVSELDAKK